MHYAIFDMDGTLIDSMGAWNRLGEEYFRSKGLNPPSDLLEKTAVMTMRQCGEYAASLGIPGRPEEIAEELNKWMMRQYRETIPARNGVYEYLQLCQNAGIRMCVATATARPLAETCLKRLRLDQYFDFLVSCEEIGKTKTSPDIYLLAAEQLGAAPSEIAVYEDVFYSAETAMQAGFPTVGVYDPASGGENARNLRERCTAFIEDWKTCTEIVL